MARHTTIDAGLRYLVADDDPAAGDLLPWAVLRCHVVDELTLEPPTAPVSLSSTTPHTRARVTEHGLCGLTARPRDVSAALLRPGGLTACVTAEGYLPRDLTSAIDVARRTLTVVAPAGASAASVAPADPAPRQQFVPGRGVLLERPAPRESDEFATVSNAPAGASDVPLRDPVAATHPIGARLAGVPISLPVQPLHRDRSVTLRGRIQVRTGPNTLAPGVGAEVAISGIWWDYPSSIGTPPLAPELSGITPPLRFAYPTGTAVDSCTITSLGVARRLITAVRPGATAIVVAPNTGLAPAGGDLLLLGDPLSASAEIVLSAGFEPAADSGALASIRLDTPAGVLHHANDAVQLVQATAITPVGPLGREALPGDTVLFAAGLPTLPTVATLILGRGTPSQAFHWPRLLPTTDGVAFRNLVMPDADGRFAWPPVARVAKLRVIASLAPHLPQPTDLTLDYGSDPTLAIILG